MTPSKVPADAVLQQASIGILVTDPEGRMVYVNPTFCQLTGYNETELLGQNPSMLQSGRQGAYFYRHMWQQLTNRGHWQGEVWNRRKDGELYAQILSINALYDESGELAGYGGQSVDITHMVRQHHKETAQQGLVDNLTRLPNRDGFSRQLDNRLQVLRPERHRLCLLVLDLDHFARLNQSLGQQACDLLLVQVAERLEQLAGDHGLLGRLGGDEFALALPEGQQGDLTTDRLAEIQRLLHKPYQLPDRAVNITASYGVTCWPDDDGDSDQLLRHAQQMMLAAKKSERSTIQIFDPNLATEEHAFHQLVEDVRSALVAGQLTLFYQPKVNLRTGQVFGAEALIRWRHPKHGLLAPGSFLPDLELHQLIIDISRWTLEQAMQQLSAWLEHKLALPISVNIPVLHLRENTFVEEVKDLLARYPNVPASLLELELLETAAIGELEQTAYVIKDCRQLGVQVSLDDFGTGYASLAYLRQLQVDTLKVDQSFIRDMLVDTDDFAIVESVLKLAESFGRQVVAEGVETEEHAITLLRLGCDQVQGYYLARPMPAADLFSWQASYEPAEALNPWRLPVANPAERPLIHAEVWHRNWLQLAHQQLSPDQAEALANHEHCQLGRWLWRAKQESSEVVGLKELDSKHQQVHELARQLAHNPHHAELPRQFQTASAELIAALRNTAYHLNHYQDL